MDRLAELMPIVLAAAMISGPTMAETVPAKEAAVADAAAPAKPELFAFADWTWLTGHPRTSALSLNFFLTRPYLTLTIEKTDDIIAFAGLTVCGLFAAVLGSRRRKQASALAAARRRLERIHAALEADDPAVPLKTRLTDLLGKERP